MAEQGVTDELPTDFQLQVEEVARRLHCDEGEWTIEFQLMAGRLVKTRRHHGPIRNEELARFTRSEG